MKDAENAQLALVRQKRLLEILMKDSQKMNRLNLIQKLQEIIALNQMAVKNIEVKDD